MKNILNIICIFLPTGLFACPTCVGRVTPDSPPFFSAEFYQPGKPIHDPKEQFVQQQFKKLIQEKGKQK